MCFVQGAAAALQQKLAGEREGVRAKMEHLQGRFRLLADYEVSFTCVRFKFVFENVMMPLVNA